MRKLKFKLVSLKSQASSSKARAKLMCLSSGLAPMRHSQQMCNSAMTPPNCPQSSANFTGKINDYHNLSLSLSFFSSNLCSYIRNLHTTRPASDGNKSQYLHGADFHTMRMLSRPPSSKRTIPAGQNPVPKLFRLARTWCQMPYYLLQAALPANTATSLLPSAAAYTCLIITQGPV